MEIQPQNPELMINPENFTHTYLLDLIRAINRETASQLL